MLGLPYRVQAVHVNVLNPHPLFWCAILISPNLLLCTHSQIYEVQMTHLSVLLDLTPSDALWVLGSQSVCRHAYSVYLHCIAFVFFLLLTLLQGLSYCVIEST